jgi:hypothetical protein
MPLTKRNPQSLSWDEGRNLLPGGRSLEGILAVDQPFERLRSPPGWKNKLQPGVMPELLAHQADRSVAQQPSVWIGDERRPAERPEERPRSPPVLFDHRSRNSGSGRFR